MHTVLLEVQTAAKAYKQGSNPQLWKSGGSKHSLRMLNVRSGLGMHDFRRIYVSEAQERSKTAMIGSGVGNGY